MKMTKELILHNLIKIAEKAGLDLDGDLVTFVCAGDGAPVRYFIDIKYFIANRAPISNPLEDESHIDSWSSAEELVKDIYNGKYRAIMSTALNLVDISAITGRLRDVEV